MVFPDIPNTHALAVLLLALFLFTREKILLESASLFILVCLIVGFELFPYKGVFGEVRPTAFSMASAITHWWRSAR